MFSGWLPKLLFPSGSVALVSIRADSTFRSSPGFADCLRRSIDWGAIAFNGGATFVPTLGATATVGFVALVGVLLFCTDDTIGIDGIAATFLAAIDAILPVEVGLATVVISVGVAAFTPIVDVMATGALVVAGFPNRTPVCTCNAAACNLAVFAIIALIAAATAAAVDPGVNFS